MILFVTVSLTSLTNGMLLAWSSPSLVKLTQDKETYDISEDEASWFTVIPPIVMVIACPIFSKLADIFGRKRVLYLICIPQILAWVLKAVARSIFLFYFTRVLYGVADGILFAVLPMYVGEVSTPAVRSRWANLFTFSIYFGNFFINVMSLKLDIPSISYVALVFPTIFACTFFFFPETPYFLLMKSKNEEAKASLEWLLRKDVEEDLKQLRSDVDRQMSETGTWIDLFIITSNRRALLISIFSRVSQQFTGITSYVVYIAYIFDRAGGNNSPALSAVLYMGLNFSLNFVASFSVSYFGTKKSYIVSMAACTVAIGSLSLYFYLDDMVPAIDISSISWFPLMGMLAYIIFASFGVAIVPSLIMGELFSASIKAKGLAVHTFVLGTCQFLSNYLFYSLYASFGFFAPFLFFSLCSFISTITSFCMIPETTGKTLEQIQQDFAGKKKERLAGA